MATSKKKVGPRPVRSAVEIEQKGLDALGLLNEYAARLSDRLPAGMVGGLGADLGSIGVVVPGAVAARLEQKGATQTQNEAAATAKSLVMGIRKSLVAAGVAKASRVEFGEGAKVTPAVVKSVIAAGRQILARAETHPEELREAGVLDRDVAALREAVDAASEADRRQEARKKASRDATATRDETLVRVERTVRRIAAAGQLEFVSEPEVRRRFEALVPALTKTKKAAASASA